MTIARTDATGRELDAEFAAWQSSLGVDVRLLVVDVEGSLAHVEGLRAAGLLTPAEADALSTALRPLPARVERGEVALPPEEDVHMAVEAWLRSEVGAVADKLHTGRSRNDQVALDLRLWARGEVARLAAALDVVGERAEQWAARHGEVAMPAYTHRQVAVPVLARAWIEGALTVPLGRDRGLLELVRRELDSSPLGAGAVGGSTLPIDPARTARALGFAASFENPIDAVGERDFALGLAFSCARIGLHLSRLCADVVELCSDGLFALDGAIAGGSSMMPHKKNPDLFELVRGHAALRCGELAGLFSLFHGLGSGYHRDLQHDKALLFSAVDGTLGCLKMIALGLPGLAPVSDACRRALRDGDAIATDLCEALVGSGLPFREAYKKVGALVAAQRERGRRLVDLTAQDLGAAGLPESLLDRLDVEQSARRRSARPPGQRAR